MSEPIKTQPLFTELGKAVGLLKSTPNNKDTDGNIEVTWPLALVSNSKLAFTTRRQHLLNAMASMLGERDKLVDDSSNPPFPKLKEFTAVAPQGYWYSVYSKDKTTSLPIYVSLGESKELVGLGARRLPSDTNLPSLRLLAQGWVFGADANSGLLGPKELPLPIRTRGRILLKDGGLVKSLDLGLGLQPFGGEPSLEALLELGYKDGTDQLKILGSDFSEPLVLIGKAVKLAVSIFRRYILHKAAQPEATFAQRLRDHLFPLFGCKTADGKTIIASFPLDALFINAQRESALLGWLKQFIPQPLKNGQLLNLDAPATFVGHLAALLFPSKDQKLRTNSRTALVDEFGLLLNGAPNESLGFGVIGEHTYSYDIGAEELATVRMTIGGRVVGLKFPTASNTAGWSALGPDVSARMVIGARGHETTIALRLAANGFEVVHNFDELNALLADLPSTEALEDLKELQTALESLRTLETPSIATFFNALQALDIPTSSTVQLTDTVDLQVKLLQNALDPNKVELELSAGDYINISAPTSPPTGNKLRVPVSALAGLPFDLAFELGYDHAPTAALFIDGFKLPLLPDFLPAGSVKPEHAIGLLLPLLTTGLSDLMTHQVGTLAVGQLLQNAKLGQWQNNEFKPHQISNLATNWTPLEAAKGILSSFNSSLEVGSLKIGLESSKITVKPSSGNAAKLFDTGNSELEVQSLAVNVVNGDAWEPSFSINGLKLRLHGSKQKPLFEANGFWLGEVSTTVSATVGLPSAFQFEDIHVRLADLRLPLGQSSGLVGKLLSPKGSDNPGLSLDIKWNKNSGVSFGLDGVPKFIIPIDKRIGPLDVERLVVEYRGADKKLFVTLDSHFSLAGIGIYPFGLGVSFKPEEMLDPGKWSFNLDGLGLSFSQGSIHLSGMFRKVGDEFQGAALVSAFGYQLAAIGAYRPANQQDDQPSLFIFAALDAPLGGPPWFFVTGVAGGFGYNRALQLPDISSVKDLAFFKLMRGGDLAQIASSLNDGKTLVPKRGAIWLAGGVNFTCFSLIKGQALLYVVFGPYFEVGVAAVAELGLATLANIEVYLLGRFTTANNDPNLLIQGQLSENSWLFAKDACRLHGGFAFQVWFKRGDCVLTIGGYHPQFKRPEHYPVVPRLGFSWSVGAGIVAKGECYCAITPRAAMAGASLEVSGQWGPVGAGFYAHFDALLSWDPFYFRLNLEIGVWVRVFGFKLEVGVGLYLHGPPVGGVGTIKCFFITISIPFGDSREPDDQALSLADFVSKHLRLAGRQQQRQVIVPGFLGAVDQEGKREPGLFQIEFKKGQAQKEGESADEPNGSVEHPYRLNIEFDLHLTTRIPLTKIHAHNQEVYNQPEAKVSFNPCRTKAANLISEMTIAGKQGPVITPIFGRVPAALFAPYTDASAGEATLHACTGVRIDGTATLHPANANAVPLHIEVCNASERFPLPIGLPLPANLLSSSAQLESMADARGRVETLGELNRLRPGLATHLQSRTSIPVVRSLGAGIVAASTSGLIDRSDQVLPPPPVTEIDDLVLRPIIFGKPWFPASFFDMPTVANASRKTTVVGRDELPRKPRVLPIARRAELASVVLHQAPVRAVRPGRVLRAGALGTQALAAFDIALRTTGALLKAGQSVTLHDLHHTQPAPFTMDGLFDPAKRYMLLDVSGSQWLRVLAVGGHGVPVLSALLSPGVHLLPLPKRTERMLLSGVGGAWEDTDSLETEVETIMQHRQYTAPPPRTSGLHMDTPLVRIGDYTYAGPGCLLSLWRGSRLADRPALTVGERVFEAADEVEVTFLHEDEVLPPASELMIEGDSGQRSLVVMVAPPQEDAVVSVLEAVQCSSPDIELPAPRAVVGPEGIALVFPITLDTQTKSNIRVRVEVAQGYGLRSVALLPLRQSSKLWAEETVTALQKAPRWNLVDDRLLTRSGRSLVRLLEMWD